MPNENMIETHNTWRSTAILNLLLGIWIFVSPWVYGSYGNPNSWNSWIVGVIIVILAAARASGSAGSQPLAWINMILGAWIFFSPWIFAYTANTGYFINSLCAGGLVFLLSLYGASMQARMTPTTHARF